MSCSSERRAQGAPSVADVCDARVRIPLRPEVRSLNLATSAALALGEALRQTATLPGDGYPARFPGAAGESIAVTIPHLPIHS